jgi:hypothetical protein
LWMIMIKITWPPTCTYRCLWLIGSVILQAWWCAWDGPG